MTEDQTATTTAPRTPRPPARLTADRIEDHLAKYDRHLTKYETELLGEVVLILDQLPHRLQAAAARRRAAAEDGDA